MTTTAPVRSRSFDLDTVRERDELRAAWLSQVARTAERTSTARAYAGDWRAWCAWCEREGCAPLPVTADRLAAFVADAFREAGHKLATVRRRVAGIVATARAHGQDDDPRAHGVYRRAWRAIPVELATSAPALVRERRASAIRADHVALILATFDTSEPDRSNRDDVRRYRRALRDRALVLLSRELAWRPRSEAPALRVDGVAFVRDRTGAVVGASVVTVARKTSQVRTRKVGPTTAGALAAWVAELAREAGPVFVAIDRWGHLSREAVTGQAVDRIVRGAGEAAGLDVVATPHGLRAGTVTDLRAAGWTVDAVQDVTGHASAAMVRRYDRDAGGALDVAGALGIDRLDVRTGG